MKEQIKWNVNSAEGEWRIGATLDLPGCGQVVANHVVVIHDPEGVPVDIYGILTSVEKAVLLEAAKHSEQPENPQ